MTVSIVSRGDHKALYTNAGCCVKDLSSIWQVTQTNHVFSYQTGCSVFIRCSSFEYPMVDLSLCFIFPLSMSTGWDCHSKTYRSSGQISIKPSIKDVLSTTTPSKNGAIANQILVLKLPRRRCNRMTLSYFNGCFIAVRSAGKLFRFIWLCRSWDMLKERIRFTLAPVSRSHVALCIIVVVHPYDTWSLYVGLPSTRCGLLIKGTRVVFPCYLPLIRQSGRGRIRVRSSWSASQGISLMGFLDTFNIGLTQCRRCTAVGRDVILGVFGQGLSCSSVSGQARDVVVFPVCHMRKFRSDDDKSPCPR